MYLPRKTQPLIPSLAHSSGHVATRMDTNWDIKTDIVCIGLGSIGQVVGYSRKGYMNVTPSSCAVLASCDIAISASFQSRKGGDSRAPK
jgi:hypothetical protein